MFYFRKKSFWSILLFLEEAFERLPFIYLFAEVSIIFISLKTWAICVLIQCNESIPIFFKCVCLFSSNYSQHPNALFVFRSMEEDWWDWSYSCSIEKWIGTLGKWSWSPQIWWWEWSHGWCNWNCICMGGRMVNVHTKAHCSVPFAHW